MPPAKTPPKPDLADQIAEALRLARVDAQTKGHPFTVKEAAQLIRTQLLEALRPAAKGAPSPFGDRKAIPPTPTLVTAYSLSRDRNAIIDGEAFCDFYESKGWVVGKTKMKDWQAAVRTWQRTSRPGPHGPGTEPFRKDYTKL